MASQRECTVAQVTSGLRNLTQLSEDLLRDSRNVFKESREQFVNNKIGKMFGLATAYRSCFDRLGVKTKRQMEKVIKDNFRDHDVRELFDELHDIEEDWNLFLMNIDKELEGDTSDRVCLGEEGPIHVPLIDARTGVSTSLHDSQSDNSMAELTSAGGEVIVVSFGERAGALQWLDDTKCPFPMLLDVERKVYHAFGLKRSVHKVWSVEAMVYYAEQMIAGKSLPKPYENVHDDTQQMGGDFILDKDGKVRFLYPSKTSMDRPDVSTIIHELKKINADKLGN